MNDAMHAEVVNQGPVAVIFRKDAANNKVGFLQQTLSLAEDGGRIEVWHGHGKETKVVPLSYYHSTTKISDVEETELAQQFAKEFQPVFGISLRKRLGKDLSLHHTMPKSAVETLQKKPFVKTEYMEKLSLALQAAIKAALEAVNAEYATK